MVSNELIVTAAGVVGGLIVGIFTIRQTLISNKRDSDSKYASMISAEGKRVTDFIGSKLEIIDTKFRSVDRDTEQVEKDISKVEENMKNMIKRFQIMCETLSTHEYVVKHVIPEFKVLEKEFDIFSSAVATRLKMDELVTSNKDVENKGSDEGNVDNIQRTKNNRDEIQS